MPGTIELEPGTKPAHIAFIGWLNEMLNNYKPGFYDGAVKNTIDLAFIKEHFVFMLELFQDEGKQLSSFLTMLPTDTTTQILMIHTMDSGEPYLYNSVNGNDIFEVNQYGQLVRFYENITIDLYNRQGQVRADCRIVFEDLYGIKCPMFYIRSKPGDGHVIGKGLLDTYYEGRYSGTYSVKNTPLEDYPKYKVTNITLMELTMDIPILTNLSLRYVIPAGQAVVVPITDWTKKYFKEAKDLEAIKLDTVGMHGVEDDPNYGTGTPIIIQPPPPPSS